LNVIIKSNVKQNTNHEEKNTWTN